MAPFSSSELRTGIRAVKEKFRANVARMAATASSTFTMRRNWSSEKRSMIFPTDSLCRSVGKSESLPLPPCSGQNPADFLWRNRQPFGHARNFLIFFLPHPRDHDLSELFCQLLKSFLSGDSLGPRPQERINAPLGHDLLLQPLEFLPHVVGV